MVYAPSMGFEQVLVKERTHLTCRLARTLQAGMNHCTHHEIAKKYVQSKPSLKLRRKMCASHNVELSLMDSYTYSGNHAKAIFTMTNKMSESYRFLISEESSILNSNLYCPVCLQLVHTTSICLFTNNPDEFSHI